MFDSTFDGKLSSLSILLQKFCGLLLLLVLFRLNTLHVFLDHLSKMKDYDLLKSFTKKIYFVGTGNFWYEDGIGNDRSLIYRIYVSILFFMYGSMTFLEIMAAFKGNFPDDEKSDCITFAVSHTVVMLKIISVIYNKELIRKLNYDIAHICEQYEERFLHTEKYRIIKVNVIAYFVTVYGAAACFIFEGVRKMQEGSHFVTVVTYYPSHEDNTTAAFLFRIYNTIVLLLMMMTMIVSVDAFTMVNLIIFKYKIITLKNYFERLNEEFIKNNTTGNYELATEKLTKGLIEGFKMHKEILRILKVIDKAFGFVISLQLCQSSCSAVSLLLQIALSDQLTFVASLKIFFFVVGLFLLLGLFLCNAGEITYQAALLADSIVYCGWYASPVRSQGKKKLGTLVLFAYTLAQKPVVLKAFNMIELTYGTFLMVIKGTYSVFTLIYTKSGKH